MCVCVVCIQFGDHTPAQQRKSHHNARTPSRNRSGAGEGWEWAQPLCLSGLVCVFCACVFSLMVPPQWAVGHRVQLKRYAM